MPQACPAVPAAAPLATFAAKLWPDDAFDRFWSVYPRKEERERAHRALMRVRADWGVPFEAVLVGVGCLVAADMPLSTVPLAATWLAAKDWGTVRPRAAAERTAIAAVVDRALGPGSTQPFPADPFYCASERETLAAGLLSAAVMVGHLTLSDEPACRRTLRAAGIDLDTLGDAGFRAAHGVALRMFEDRARHATAFREPRR